MLLSQAAVKFQTDFRGLPTVVIEQLILPAMREFCEDSFVIVRGHEANMRATQQGMICAPEGVEILSLLHAESANLGELDVGLMESVNRASRPAISHTEGRVAVLASPLSTDDTIKVFYAAEPAAESPVCFPELVTGRWRRAVLNLALRNACMALEIEAFNPAQAGTFDSLYRKELSTARRVASNFGGKQLHRVPAVSMDGISSPTDVAAPPTGYSPFSNDMGTVEQEVGSVIDMGGF